MKGNFQYRNSCKIYFACAAFLIVLFNVNITSAILEAFRTVMAANRKLLADVEKTLKKIAEGQKAFQDIFDKFNESVNQAQKEKFENELKREIKKLQRYREQIKSWQASNEIKDKRNLGDARRSIESDMERFKVIEKETKTKAYSKEGLGAEQKKDPLQKEKEDIMEWVRENITALEMQIEKLEYDIELMVANGKKKKLDRDRQDEMDAKKEIIGKHRFHIQRLEAIMRMLDNDNLELEKVKTIKDDVEYYVNQNEEADFWENYNENIYDELELEDIGDISSAAILATSPHDSMDEPPTSSVAGSEGSRDATGSGGGSGSRSATAADPLAPPPPAPVSVLEPPPPRLSQQLQQQQHLPLAAPAAGAPMQHPYPYPQPPPLLLSSLSQPQQQQQQQLPATTTTAGGSSQATTNDGSDREGSTASASEVASPSVLSSGPLKLSQDAFSNLGGSANSQSSSQGGGGGLMSFRLNPVGPVSQQQHPLLMQQQQQQTVAAPVSSLLSGGDAVGGIGGSAAALADPPQQRTAFSIAARTAAANPVPASSQQQAQALPQAAAAVTAAAAPAAATPSSAYFLGQAEQQQQQHPAELKQLSQVILARQQQQQQLQQQQQQQQQQQLQQQQQQQLLQQQQPSSGGSVAGYQSYMSQSAGSAAAAAVAAAAAAAAANAAATAAAQQQLQQQQQQPLQTIRLDPMSIAAPLRSQTPPRLQEALSKLENGFKKLPHAADSERFRQHTTHNPTQVPFYYPQSPPAGMDTEEFYSRLDVHTLFFIFYYFEGTKAQYLAAKALKKMSWRFHTKYLTWFQRHEEPKTITDDYEKGTYVYYDYEKAVQKRREFTFEYKYLEDKDL